MTTAVYDAPHDGPTVLHFPISLHADGVHQSAEGNRATADAIEGLVRLYAGR